MTICQSTKNSRLRRIFLIFIITVISSVILVSCSGSKDEITVFERKLIEFAVSDDVYEGIFVYKNIFAPHEQVINSIIEDLQVENLRWRGINPVGRKRNEIALYFVNAKNLVENEKICGSDKHPRTWESNCKRALAVKDNCAVVQPNVIACDYKFALKLSILSTMLWLEFISEQEDFEQNKSKALQRVYNKMILEFKSSNNIYNMGSVIYKYNQIRAQGFGKPHNERVLLDQEYNSVLKGLWKFVIIHEIGHIVLGHVSDDSMPLCVQKTPWSSNIPSIEKEADNYFLHQMINQNIPIDENRENFFSPYFFSILINYEMISTLLDAGATIEELEDLTSIEGDVYNIAIAIYLARTCGGEHPYLNHRFYYILQSEYYQHYYAGIESDKRFEFIRSEIEEHDKQCRNMSPQMRQLVDEYLSKNE
jgi:hypothetical protein